MSFKFCKGERLLIIDYWFCTIRKNNKWKTIELKNKQIILRKHFITAKNAPNTCQKYIYVNIYVCIYVFVPSVYVQAGTAQIFCSQQQSTDKSPEVRLEKRKKYSNNNLLFFFLNKKLIHGQKRFNLKKTDNKKIPNWLTVFKQRRFLSVQKRFDVRSSGQSLWSCPWCWNDKPRGKLTRTSWNWTGTRVPMVRGRGGGGGGGGVSNR